MRRGAAIAMFAAWATACASEHAVRPVPPKSTVARPAVEKASRTRDQRDVPTISDSTPWCWRPLPVVPGDDDTGAFITRLSIAASGDELWLAWSTQTGHVIHWRHGAWESVAPTTGATFDGLDPTLAIASAGMVVAAWHVNSKDQSEVQVAKRTGASWTLLDIVEAYSDPFTNAGDQDLVADAVGNPLIAWTESRPGSGGGCPCALHVARQVNGGWVTLGGTIDGAARAPRLALDRDGNPWLAWLHDHVTGNELRVARWADGHFVDVSPGDGANGVVSFAFAMGGPRGATPLLAAGPMDPRHTGDAFMEWTDGVWNRHNPPGHGDVALAPLRDGSTVLALSGAAGGVIGSITVERLTGDGWRAMLQGVNAQPGPTDTFVVAAAAHRSGVYLAWHEPGPDRHSIRVIDVQPCAEREAPQPFEPSPTRSSFWPKTIDEALAMLLKDLPPDGKEKIRTTAKQDLIQFHFGLGMGIRNRFGLWQGNDALRRSCGDVHPDTCSMKIIEALWARLQHDSATKKP